MRVSFCFVFFCSVSFCFVSLCFVLKTISLFNFTFVASRNLSDWWLAYWISHTKTHHNITNQYSTTISAAETRNNVLGGIHIVKGTVTFYLIVYAGFAVSNTVRNYCRYHFMLWSARCTLGLRKVQTRALLLCFRLPTASIAYFSESTF